MKKQITSPCVSICQLDDNQEICLGCFRTVAEITHWVELSEEQRCEIVALLSARRQNYENQH